APGLHPRFPDEATEARGSGSPAKVDFANNLQLSLTVAALSVGLWWTFDRSRSGLGLGLGVAVLGTAGTQLLVHHGVYRYSSPDFLYVRSWLPSIFFAGGVTVGNIGRQLAMVSRPDPLRDRHGPARGPGEGRPPRGRERRIPAPRARAPEIGAAGRGDGRTGRPRGPGVRPEGPGPRGGPAGRPRPPPSLAPLRPCAPVAAAPSAPRRGRPSSRFASSRL
uniref:Insulin-induced gene protein n=1 Tax=Ornithorhynchus anatinus TaxID=9258 RepID=A0A6I8NX25_ORNAN